eukprot:scaffold27177_cov90-Isochrysis_galbana.AAC.2
MDAGIPLVPNDFDGPKSLVETLTICDYDNYIHQGRKRANLTGVTPPRAAGLVLDAMCQNIDVSGHLDITEYPKPTDPSKNCLDVSGIQSGRGSDNLQFRESVILDDCTAYDTCPVDGISGVDRGQTGDDSFICPSGASIPGGGEYPPGQLEPGLRNQPYRWTMTKFVCLQFPGQTSQVDFKYKVSRSRDGQFGRNFLIAGFAADISCLPAPSPPPSAQPNVSPPPPSS